MGRDKRNEQRVEHYTKLIRNTMETPAWRALSPVAQALYPWLKLEWRGPDPLKNNNGQIGFPVRQAAEALGVSVNTAAKGYHELQAKGFLVVTQKAQLGIKGRARESLFELTELPLPNSPDRDGRKLYKQWATDRDFPVVKPATSNPEGRNGKSKTRLKNDDGTVIEFETKRAEASQK